MLCLELGNWSHPSSIVFLMLLVGREGTCCVDMPQVPRYPGPLGSNCTWDANRFARLRASMCQSPLNPGHNVSATGPARPATLPLGSESSLQVLPGCFHAANQQPGILAPSPCRIHHHQTPQQGLGRNSYLGTTVRGTGSVLQPGKSAGVCDSSPPNLVAEPDAIFISLSKFLALPPPLRLLLPFTPYYIS